MRTSFLKRFLVLRARFPCLLDSPWLDGLEGQEEFVNGRDIAVVKD